MESGESRKPQQETTTMKGKYARRGRADKRAARELLAGEGQHLLPLIDVFVRAGHALDTIIDVIGRAAIEAVLEIGAADVAGPRQPGRRRGEGGVAYHGRQTGRVYLSDRAVRVEKPRLRRSGEGEVAIPAYEVPRRPEGLGARARLFVIDGSKALRKAVGQVFGKACRVQRCRNHKMRNVLGQLPKALHDQARAVLRAAWKLSEQDGKARIEKFASWVEEEHPAAAGSLREGLGELFTVSELGLTPSLRRCLGTTNLIDNAHSGMRQRMRRVTHWRDGSMVLRWAAAAFMDAEQNYRRIMGYRDLRILKAHLDELTTPVAKKEIAS